MGQLTYSGHVSPARALAVVDAINETGHVGVLLGANDEGFFGVVADP